MTGEDGVASAYKPLLPLPLQQSNGLGAAHTNTHPTPTTIPAKVTLDRAKLSSSRSLLFCLSFVVLDSSKQVLSYAVSYYNNDIYPLPQTLIVLLIELVKLLLLTFFMIRENLFTKFRFSLVFAVPAVIYAFNNNLYLFALHYTTPPVWMILIQGRVILTALVYRFIFHRQVTALQWSALIILIFSILVTKLSDSSIFSWLSGQTKDVATMTNFTTSTTSHYPSTPTDASQDAQLSSITVAIILSFISASLSVMASVYTEFLFKNDKRPFNEQQFQLYFFSSITAGLLTILSEIKTGDITTGLDMPSSFIIFLLTLVVFISSLGGIAVATIMKKLDNIVKIYLAILANIFNGIVCSILFPSRFSLSFTFLLALSLVFLAIYLYEKKMISLDDFHHLLPSELRCCCEKTIFKYICIPCMGILLGAALALFLSAYVFHWDFHNVTPHGLQAPQMNSQS